MLARFLNEAKRSSGNPHSSASSAAGASSSSKPVVNVVVIGALGSPATTTTNATTRRELASLLAAAQCTVGHLWGLEGCVLTRDAQVLSVARHPETLPVSRASTNCSHDISLLTRAAGLPTVCACDYNTALLAGVVDNTAAIRRLAADVADSRGREPWLLVVVGASVSTLSDDLALQGPRLQPTACVLWDRAGGTTTSETLDLKALEFVVPGTPVFGFVGATSTRLSWPGQPVPRSASTATATKKAPDKDKDEEDADRGPWAPFVPATSSLAAVLRQASSSSSSSTRPGLGDAAVLVAKPWTLQALCRALWGLDEATLQRSAGGLAPWARCVLTRSRPLQVFLGEVALALKGVRSLAREEAAAMAPSSSSSSASSVAPSSSSSSSSSVAPSSSSSSSPASTFLSPEQLAAKLTEAGDAEDPELAAAAMADALMTAAWARAKQKKKKKQKTDVAGRTDAAFERWTQKLRDMGTPVSHTGRTLAERSQARTPRIGVAQLERMAHNAAFQQQALQQSPVDLLAAVFPADARCLVLGRQPRLMTVGQAAVRVGALGTGGGAVAAAHAPSSAGLRLFDQHAIMVPIPTGVSDALALTTDFRKQDGSLQCLHLLAPHLLRFSTARRRAPGAPTAAAAAAANYQQRTLWAMEDVVAGAEAAATLPAAARSALVLLLFILSCHGDVPAVPGFVALASDPAPFKGPAAATGYALVQRALACGLFGPMMATQTVLLVLAKLTAVVARWRFENRKTVEAFVKPASSGGGNGVSRRAPHHEWWRQRYAAATLVEATKGARTGDFWGYAQWFQRQVVASCGTQTLVTTTTALPADGRLVEQQWTARPARWTKRAALRWAAQLPRPRARRVRPRGKTRGRGGAEPLYHADWQAFVLEASDDVPGFVRLGPDAYALALATCGGRCPLVSGEWEASTGSAAVAALDTRTTPSGECYVVALTVTHRTRGPAAGPPPAPPTAMAELVRSCEDEAEEADVAQWLRRCLGRGGGSSGADVRGAEEDSEGEPSLATAPARVVAVQTTPELDALLGDGSVLVDVAALDALCDGMPVAALLTACGLGPVETTALLRAFQAATGRGETLAVADRLDVAQMVQQQQQGAALAPSGGGGGLLGVCSIFGGCSLVVPRSELVCCSNTACTFRACFDCTAGFWVAAVAGRRGGVVQELPRCAGCRSPLRPETCHQLLAAQLPDYRHGAELPSGPFFLCDSGTACRDARGSAVLHPRSVSEQEEDAATTGCGATQSVGGLTCVACRSGGQSIRNCPRCQARTAHAEACFHMTCTAIDSATGEQCGADWCWHCGDEFDDCYEHMENVVTAIENDPSASFERPSMYRLPLVPNAAATSEYLVPVSHPLEG